MKTGKHYFGLLTEEEQRNFKEACDETQRAKNFDELMEQSPKQPLATFRLIFIYSVIVFLVMCLLMVIHTASYKQGYKSGYRNGIEKVDSIVNYEELTTESVEAVQKLQLNTMRQ